MKKNRWIACILIVSLFICTMVGCANTNATPTPTSTPPNINGVIESNTVNMDNFSIEIEDASGEKFLLTAADLYYRFYLSAQNSGILVNSWEHPSEIDGSYLTNFFAAQSHWNEIASDAEPAYLKQELVEEYLKMYFDIEATQVRQSIWYKPEEKSYEVPLHPLEYPCTITGATTDSNKLTIFYETYDYFKEDLPVSRQGHVTIEIRRYPFRWKFLSNELTFLS